MFIWVLYLSRFDGFWQVGILLHLRLFLYFSHAICFVYLSWQIKNVCTFCNNSFVAWLEFEFTAIDICFGLNFTNDFYVWFWLFFKNSICDSCDSLVSCNISILPSEAPRLSCKRCCHKYCGITIDIYKLVIIIT